MHQDYYSNKYAKNDHSVQQPRSRMITTQTMYSVPCINCENLIPINEIDIHTIQCLSVSKSVSTLLKSNKIMDEINFKIQKLRDSVLQLNQKESNLDNIKYLNRADEMSEYILMIHNTNQIELRKLYDLNQELKTITESYRGSLAIALYLERLHSLVLQKQAQMEKEMHISRVDTQKINLSNYNSQNNYSSVQSFRYQQQPEQNKNSQLLLPFQSPFNCRPTIITKFSISQNRNQLNEIKSEILTKISTSQFDENEINQNEFDLNNSNQINQQQRIFYSKCLTQKTKLPNTHLSQKIPLFILYKEMLQRNIPSDLWDKFIIDALNNPHFYIDKNKVQMSKGLKNQLGFMSQKLQLKQSIHNIQ
ncbi:unnamed protein product [Paramecium pentaurelia]|uniref:Uncharacterized protein n=1 Tax=Paramecium pentaurelia TaxID=43138 RepID=A0A8S1WNN6_9CILI|nr:unnamed protein product [Paramecium pentaurelia]